MNEIKFHLALVKIRLDDAFLVQHRYPNGVSTPLFLLTDLILTDSLVLNLMSYG